MTNKVAKVVKNESFLMEKWEDEEFIEGKLEELGFDMDYTTWVYSWTVPSWVSVEKKNEITKKLEDSDYRSYLVNVRQESPK